MTLISNLPTNFQLKDIFTQDFTPITKGWFSDNPPRVDFCLGYNKNSLFFVRFFSLMIISKH